MCTRFVYNGKKTIVGFNFEIDLSVWDHKVFMRQDEFYIGIKYNGDYHSYHGVNANGNVGTLLYIHECEAGKYREAPSCYRVDCLSERFNKGKVSFDDAVGIVKEKRIINAPDCSMQVMLSDRNGRVLIAEPGIGYKVEKERYSLLTNYSIIEPERTKPYITAGDNRYECAKKILDTAADDFDVKDALHLLREISQEGLWATRVSFVYSVEDNRVYYLVNNDFANVQEHQLCSL